MVPEVSQKDNRDRTRVYKIVKFPHRNELIERLKDILAKKIEASKEHRLEQFDPQTLPVYEPIEVWGAAEPENLAIEFNTVKSQDKKNLQPYIPGFSP